MVHPTPGPEFSPLNLRQELGFKDSPCLEPLWDAATEKQPTLGEIDEDVTNNLAQVHAADHFLKPAMKVMFMEVKKCRMCWDRPASTALEGREHTDSRWWKRKCYLTHLGRIPGVHMYWLTEFSKMCPETQGDSLNWLHLMGSFSFQGLFLTSQEGTHTKPHPTSRRVGCWILIPDIAENLACFLFNLIICCLNN